MRRCLTSLGTRVVQIKTMVWKASTPTRTAITMLFNRKQVSSTSSNWNAYIAGGSESESEVAQSCPTLCDPMDCSPPGSSLHGILQARVLEWGAISFSRGSSQPRDRTRFSRISGGRSNLWATREALKSVLNGTKATRTQMIMLMWAKNINTLNILHNTANEYSILTLQLQYEARVF